MIILELMIFQNMYSLVWGNEFGIFYKFLKFMKKDKENPAILLCTCDHQGIDIIRINTTPMHIAIESKYNNHYSNMIFLAVYI